MNKTSENAENEYLHHKMPAQKLEAKTHSKIHPLGHNLTMKKPAITSIVLGLCILILSTSAVLQARQAWGHVDPVLATTPNSQIAPTVLRDADNDGCESTDPAIVGDGPVVQGTTICYFATLNAASAAGQASRENGAITIQNPNQFKNSLAGTNVTPAAGIPCIGNNVGAPTFDDSDPPTPNGPNDGVLPDGDDCDEGADGNNNSRLEVKSDFTSYVVDCDDILQTIAGPRLQARATWNGFHHLNSGDSVAGAAIADLLNPCIVPTIEWEKRLQSGSPGSHPLQGGATFRVSPDPLDGVGDLLVTDNDVNDIDLTDGQFKLNNTLPGTYTITEETAPNPEVCEEDPDARMVTVSETETNPVIGTQGSDDDGGNVNERDFHNECLGMIEWEKRNGTNAPPHPLQGGATFRISPDPFDGAGTLTVVDNGLNDVNPAVGQIKVNGTLPGVYTVEETNAPNGCNLDNGDRVVIVTVVSPNQVIGTQNFDDHNGDINERDFHNICNVPPGNIIVKTIHAEKQNYTSTLEQGNIPVIVDVTIIAEIYEDFGSKSIIQKQVVVVECTKQIAPAKALGCEAYVPDDGIIPVKNCSEVPLQFPPVMNSVINKAGVVSESDASNMNLNTIQRGNTAKTIDAQKEVFECLMNTLTDTSDDKKVDLVLFTEIFENLNTQTSDEPQILSLKCVTRISTHTVESCRFENIPV